MRADKDNQNQDWELSEEYYKENEDKREWKLEDFIEDEVAEEPLISDTAGLHEDVKRVAADVRRVKELSGQGKTVVEIAGMMRVEPKYVSDIQVCIQSFPEDNDIAVAHLILMG